MCINHLTIDNSCKEDSIPTVHILAFYSYQIIKATNMKFRHAYVGTPKWSSDSSQQINLPYLAAGYP